MKVMTPVFDGAQEEDIRDCFREAGLPEDGKTILLTEEQVKCLTVELLLIYVLFEATSPS